MITTREELSRLRESWKAEGKIVGFTSGVFDLIHAGHVDYLEKAKEKCDILIVALNSDESVKRYKGEDRPLTPEKERLKLISGLKSVDHVFTFNERRNKTNIETLKPDVYIKGGDHSKANLLSAEIVESYGGNVQLIPLTYSTSSSDTIDKILKVFGNKKPHEFATEKGATYIQRRETKKYPAILLDRDGTINEEVGYLSEPEKFRFLPNVLSALKKLQNAGFKLIIITNQNGIGLGYYSKEDFFKVNSHMFKLLSEDGITIDKIYFCPHSKGENCQCRKPNLALLKRAQEEANIEIKNTWMIGDKSADIEAGKRFGCKTIRVATGHSDQEFNVFPDYHAKDLLEAAEFIIGNSSD